MTLHPLPDLPVAEPDPLALTAAEQQSLDDMAAAGARAAAWLRARAVEQGERPDWCHGRTNPLLDLADTVEQVLGGLDPADSGHRAPDGNDWVEGQYGVPKELLDRVCPFGSVGSMGYWGANGEDHWHGNKLPVGQIATVMVLVGCVRMAVDAMGNHYEADLPKLVGTIDHAIGTPETATRARA